MPPYSSHIRDLLVERLEALRHDCDTVAENGRTFHDIDDFLYTEGRKFTQEILQQKFQERIEKAGAALLRLSLFFTAKGCAKYAKKLALLEVPFTLSSFY